MKGFIQHVYHEPIWYGYGRKAVAVVVWGFIGVVAVTAVLAAIVGITRKLVGE